MSETRVKVYRTPAEMQVDAADAAAHGWRVMEQRARTDGTLSVTYAQGSEWAPPDMRKAVSEALRDDRNRAEREKAINAIIALVVMAVALWFLFGQPTLEELQTMNVGELLDGWIFPAS